MNDLNQTSLKKSTPASPKSSPKKTFITYLVITIVIFAVATLIITSDDKTLDKFTPYEGRLAELRVTTTQHKTNEAARPIMIFKIDGLDEILGITQNAPADYGKYTDNLKVGDNVKVYYDAHPYRTVEGYNPYVLQLEKNGVVLLDIQEGNRNYKMGGYIGFGIGVLALIGTIAYYRRNVKGG